MRRVICVGNRFVGRDSAGPRVFDHLRRGEVPAGVEVIDGGLAGLGLLGLVEGAERVVFVDSVEGFGRDGEVVAIAAEDAARAAGSHHDHAAGLAYLLRALPHVCVGPAPEVLLVGIEGAPGESAIEEAGALAMRLAVGGG